MKQLIVDSSSCTGCQLCELSCVFAHENVIGLAHSRIKIVQVHEEGLSVVSVCKQCEDAPCMEVCPTNALVRNEKTGAVELVEESCIYCKKCFYACPFGVISLDEKAKTILKCDLCGGYPVCVNYCPTGAITYKEVDDASFKLKQNRAQEVLKYEDTSFLP